MLMGLFPAGCQCLGDFKARPAHGEPAILDVSESTWDGVEPLRESYPHGDCDPDAAISWLPMATPGLGAGDLARAVDAWASCAADLRRRTRLFISRAEGGVPCRLLVSRTGSAKPAKYTLDASSATLRVEELAAPGGGAGGRRCCRECRLADVQNIWVCSDSELACRALGADFHQGSADAELACVVLIDVPDGPIGLVERSAEAREEFLDCMAVLIASQRAHRAPELAMCGLRGGLPPPEAQLRPTGRSLQSVHLSGPICMWLARAGDGLLPPPSGSEAQDGLAQSV